MGSIAAEAGAAGMEGGADTSVGAVASDAANYLDTIYKNQKDALKEALDAANTNAEAMKTDAWVGAASNITTAGLSLLGNMNFGGTKMGGGSGKFNVLDIGKQ
jgi:hypothetical protein